MAQITGITSLETDELQIYRTGNEAQLLHYFEPDGGLFIAESPMVVERALDAGYRPYSMLVDEALLAKTGAGCAAKDQSSGIGNIMERVGDIPIYSGNETLLGRLTGFKLTRGILCAMYRKPLRTLNEVCANASRIAVLDGVENPANVGSIFRNAAALGIDGIILTSGCSDPLYRRSLRVSMGTSLILPWTVFDPVKASFSMQSSGTAYGLIEGQPVPRCGPYDHIDHLRTLGFTTAAMALRRDSLPPDSDRLKNIPKLAIILGNEGFGLPDEIIRKCDLTVMIPMAAGVDSLNVAAASAIAFWELAGH